MKRYIFSLIVLGLIAHSICGAGASVITKGNARMEAQIELATK